MAVSDTVINVSSAAFDHLVTGDYISLKEGATEETMSRVVSIDKSAGTITLNDATTNAFTAAGPTLVQRTTKSVNEFVIGPAWKYAFGETKIGGTFVPANKVIRMQYTNNSGVAKKLYMQFEYLR